MNVELVVYTPEPERVCAMAAMGCRSESIPRLEEIDEDMVEDVITTVRDTGHHGIFEHINFTFRVEDVSRSLSHQLVRHRLATYAQQSQRVVSGDAFGYIKPDLIRKLEEAGEVRFFENFMSKVKELYTMMEEDGIPNEDARFILPNAVTTNLTVTMNARMLMTMFEQRCCKRAQWEIREMAFKMLKQCKDVAPLVFEDAGAPCMRNDECPELDQFSCGEPYTDDEVEENLYG